MRHTLSRIPAATRSLTGAAILAGVVVSGALAQPPGSGNGVDEETAMAYPRVELRNAPGVAQPQPLTPSDGARIRRILALLEHGKLDEAQDLFAGLESPLLNGGILADVYLGPFHRSSVEELRDWLGHYGDQPEAPAIYALLLRRLPHNAPRPAAPVRPSLEIPTRSATDPTPVADAEPDIPRNPALERDVAARMGRGQTASALRLITEARHITAAYALLLRAEVSRALFTSNEDAEALQVVTAALHRTPHADQVGQADYIGGLAAWRLGRLEQARALFQAGADAPIASPAVRAAASFWAARASARLGKPGQAAQWMRRAAAEPRTLHGLIARRALGLSTGIVPSADLVSQADFDAVAATPGGRRAFAWLQVGQPRRAAEELRGVWAEVKDTPALRRSVLLVAARCGLHQVAAEFATAEAEADGTLPAAPTRAPVLQPAHGFHIDPALVYALARTESNFDPNATSAAGAHGLLQIMPVTAKFVAGDQSLSKEMLHDPAVNLALGQRYLKWLADQDPVNGNLLLLLASYNNGLGGLSRWLGQVRDGGDPLMFLEAIPVNETRAFVRDVLTYSWLYAAELHLPAPSLDAMVEGEFPRFTSSPVRGKLAATAQGG